jgi:phosphatidylglycerol:prolipoprotein diacylglycerol transferase
MVGLGIGRIGCFLNGCCYGAESNLPWAVRFHYYCYTYIEQYERRELSPDPRLLRESQYGVQLKTREEARAQGLQQLMEAEARKVHPVHPAQLYSTITALLLAALLVAYYSLPHVPGHVFALMLMLEGATRFLLEMLRVEPPVWGSSFSLSMWLGILLVGAGGALWLVFRALGGLNQGGRVLSEGSAETASRRVQPA